MQLSRKSDCMTPESLANAIAEKLSSLRYFDKVVFVRVMREALREYGDMRLEEATRVVVDYRTSGKFETGHGFMSDLDEIAIRIGSLKSSPERKASDE